MSQHIDPNTIGQLKELMGDDFNLLIETFISDSKKRIDSMADAIAATDAEMLRTSSHGLKGSALNLSAAILTELCYKLEIMGKEGSTLGAEHILEQIKDEYEHVRASLLAS